MPELPEVVRLDLPKLEYELLASVVSGGMLMMAALMIGNEDVIRLASGNLLAIRQEIERKPTLRRAQLNLLRKIAALAPASDAEIAEIQAEIDRMEQA